MSFMNLMGISTTIHFLKMISRLLLRIRIVCNVQLFKDGKRFSRNDEEHVTIPDFLNDYVFYSKL